MHPQPTIADAPQHPIVIYIRVSTPKQRDEGYSLDRQRKDAIAEALEEAQRQGFPVPPEEDILVDADTGKTCHRAGRKTLWEWVTRGEVRLVIFPCVDRMGRNTKDSIELKDHLEAYGVRMVLLKERIDTTTPAGNLFFQQMAAFAEFEGRNILERTKAGRAEKLERGEAWSTEQSTPYGLRYVKPKSKHTPAHDCYEIVPEAADTVKRAIELVAGGMSAQKVAQLFTTERLVTPHGGTTWRPSTIRQWVHNTAYHGALPRNQYEISREPDTAERRGKRRVRKLAEPHKTLAIRPLVSRELAEQARENLRNGKQRSIRNLKHQYLLWTPRSDPLLLCGKCLQEGRVQRLGGTTTTNPKKGKKYTYAIYQCLHQRPDGRMGRHKVSRDKLDNAVWAELCSILQEPENALDDIQKLTDETSAPARALEAELAAIAADLDALSIQEDRLLELYQVGTVNREKLEKRYGELNAKIDELKARETELREQHRAAVEQMVPIRDIQQACDLVWRWMGQDPPFEVKQKVVRTLLTRVVAWLEEGDEQSNGRKSPKKLHFHMEGRLPSLRNQEGEVPEFVNTTL